MIKCLRCIALASLHAEIKAQQDAYRSTIFGSLQDRTKAVMENSSLVLTLANAHRRQCTCYTGVQ